MLFLFINLGIVIRGFVGLDVSRYDLARFRLALARVNLFSSNRLKY
jgi:hypothetical protein